jgi:hypothetical protein
VYVLRGSEERIVSCTALNCLHFPFPTAFRGVNSFLGGNRGYISVTLYERRWVCGVQFGRGGEEIYVDFGVCVCGYI